MTYFLVRSALVLVQHVPTDSTLRASLLAEGHPPDDVDRHLEYMLEERLVSVHPAQGQPPIWRLKLRGKEVLDHMAKPPIGFQIT